MNRSQILWFLLHINVYNTNPRTKYWKVVFSSGSQVLFAFSSPFLFSALFLVVEGWFFSWTSIVFSLFPVLSGFPFLWSTSYFRLLDKLLRTSWLCRFSAGSYFPPLVWLGGGEYLVKECESSLEFIVWCSLGKWNYRSWVVEGEAIARPALTPITFYEGETKP